MSGDRVIGNHCVVYHHIYLPTYVSTYLSIHLSIYLPIYLPPSYLPIYLPIYLSIYLSIYLFIYLPAYLPTYLPSYLHIYLPTYLTATCSSSWGHCLQFAAPWACCRGCTRCRPPVDTKYSRSRWTTIITIIILLCTTPNIKQLERESDWPWGSLDSRWWPGGLSTSRRLL